tara:strand:+ start:220 stop:1527 length:1308 start_codon:yes stop_codon:yes gene_type:complete
MSGSIAAIAAYDGTGTQGYGTTDKNLPGVKSVFWNENDTDKYYVNGSSFSEVSSNKGEITIPETIIFTFDNDIDAINDLVLNIGATDITRNSNSGVGPTGAPPPWFMAAFIERIEICIGNQILTSIPTIQIIDLIVSDKNLNFNHGTSGVDHTISSINNGGVFTNIRLPIFNLINEKTNCSYLMACANNQTLQVKVYPQFFNTIDYRAHFLQGPVVANSGWLPNIGTNNEFTFSLYANKYSMVNAERNMLRNQVIPKRTNITQTSTISNPTLISGYPNLSKDVPITINCDHFNINADKIRIVTAGNQKVLFNIELFLNSTSYCGPILGSIKDTDRGMTYNNYLVDTIGSEGLGQISLGVSYLNIGEISLAKNANKLCTDQNYVPLSKYDSIRVVLTPLGDATESVYPTSIQYLTVIVEGKCTALYQNGAVVFNNY